MQSPSPIQDILSRRVESNVVVGITAFTKPIALETKNRTKLPRHVRGRTTFSGEGNRASRAFDGLVKVRNSKEDTFREAEPKGMRFS